MTSEGTCSQKAFTKPILNFIRVGCRRVFSLQSSRPTPQRTSAWKNGSGYFRTISTPCAKPYASATTSLPTSIQPHESPTTTEQVSAGRCTMRGPKTKTHTHARRNSCLEMISSPLWFVSLWTKLRGLPDAACGSPKAATGSK